MLELADWRNSAEVVVWQALLGALGPGVLASPPPFWWTDGAGYRTNVLSVRMLAVCIMPVCSKLAGVERTSCTALLFGFVP